MTRSKRAAAWAGFAPLLPKPRPASWANMARAISDDWVEMSGTAYVVPHALIMRPVIKADAKRTVRVLFVEIISIKSVAALVADKLRSNGLAILTRAKQGLVANLLC